MNKFVRGGMILTVSSMCVAFVYASSNETGILSSANTSQEIFENVDSDTFIAPEVQQTPQQTQGSKAKGKVVKTGSVRSTAAGSFTATAYCLRGRTAMGHGVRKGLIAADPRVLRLGSKVNLGAGAHSGEYLVSDTGGKIKGRKIDIWMASCAEARSFGRRTISVTPL
ncbi:MAG: 3D domain-containing protein [bacterium]|nr:3D domain-containing protein [bacterium]